MKKLTSEDKYNLIISIFEKCYNNIHSFYEDNIGADLSYITLAILLEQKCELHPYSRLVILLKQLCLPTDLLWDFIFVEPTIKCICCGTEIIWCEASYCDAINGWLGHECCSKIYNEEDYYEEYDLVY